MGLVTPIKSIFRGAFFIPFCRRRQNGMKIIDKKFFCSNKIIYICTQITIKTNIMIKEEIFKILRTNYELRKVVSDKLETRIVNVERWAQRKSVPSWYKDEFIKIIEKELQLTKKEIEC